MKKSFKLFVASLALSVFGLTSCQDSSAAGQTIYSNDKYVLSVELDQNNLEKDPGDEFDLRPIVTYKDGHENAEVTTRWQSSNSKVATVDKDGHVVCKAAGNANIVFMAGNEMAVCKLVVKGAEVEPEPEPTPDPENPDSPYISLSATSKTVDINEEFVLTAELTNLEGPVVWSVVDSTILSIADNGNTVTVRSLAAGETDVYATIGNVNNHCHVRVSSGEPLTPEEEEDELTCKVYFFIDFNNADPKDTTGTKKLAEFKWYPDRPFDSSKVPANPTTAMDPAFPTFLGWSSHPIIDELKDLWNLQTDVTGNRNYIYIYGIWTA